MRQFFAFCLSLVAALPTYADESAMEKFKNYLPSQVLDMPKEERSSSVPMIYIFAAQSGNDPSASLVFTLYLNRLMYPAASDYDLAIRKFQSDLGDSMTGILTVGQISELERRAELQNLGHVEIPKSFYSQISRESARVTGTITILGDKIAYPVNYTEISCTRAQMTCEYDQMYLTLPTANDPSPYSFVEKFNTEYFRIIRWEGDTIDAVPAIEGNTCRTTSLNLNFKTKEFFEFTRNNSGPCEVLGTTIPKLDAPRVSQILDGEEIFQIEFARIRQSAFDVLASEFKSKVEKHERNAAR